MNFHSGDTHAHVGLIAGDDVDLVGENLDEVMLALSLGLPILIDDVIYQCREPFDTHPGFLSVTSRRMERTDPWRRHSLFEDRLLKRPEYRSDLVVDITGLIRILHSPEKHDLVCRLYRRQLMFVKRHHVGIDLTPVRARGAVVDNNDQRISVALTDFLMKGDDELLVTGSCRNQNIFDRLNAQRVVHENLGMTSDS